MYSKLLAPSPTFMMKTTKMILSSSRQLDLYLIYRIALPVALSLYQSSTKNRLHFVNVRKLLIHKRTKISDTILTKFTCYWLCHFFLGCPFLTEVTIDIDYSSIAPTGCLAADSTFPLIITVSLTSFTISPTI